MAPERDLAGLAHVATVSFLASRASPTGGFWLALAGGVALARAAALRGLRHGYGTSGAAVVESVAIMGPARFGVPFTQAVTAPLLGRLEARGVGRAPQMLVCGLLRLLHNTATTAFFIWVLLGGVDAYAGTYDSVLERIPGAPGGTAAALVITAVLLLGWAVFASVVQVLVYQRGLQRWPQVDEDHAEPEAEQADTPSRRRFDPRAVTAAGVIAFALLIATTDWAVLAAITVWLAVAWAVCRPDLEPIPTGVVLALALAGGVLAFGLIGGIGVDTTLRRAARAALLVLVATWLRSAAGSAGLREVSSRALHRLRRIPSMPEAARLLDGLASERRLMAAGRALAAALGPVRKSPIPVLDAVLSWVAGEAGRFRTARRAVLPPLAARPRDAALIALAAAPAALLVGA
jgi:hypothetical protein